MVPVRYLAEFFGQSVSWIPEKQLVDIWEDKSVAGGSNLEAWALAMGADLAELGYSDYDPALFGYMARGDYMGINPDVSSTDMARNYLTEYFGADSREDVLDAAWALSVPAEANQYPAWDLGRVGSLAEWGYAGGYLTYAEALALTEPAARRIRTDYRSWDQFYQEYLKGRYAWHDAQTKDAPLFGVRRWSEDELQRYYQHIQEGDLLDDSLFQSDVVPVPGLTFSHSTGSFVSES